MKNIPAPGNYSAVTTGKIVIGDPEQAGGYLIANIPYRITTPGVEFSDTAPCFLVKPDGTLYQNAIKNLRSAFGWDGLDFFALEEIESGKNLDLVDCTHRTRTIKDEQGNESEITDFRIGFINAPGANRVEPMSDDAKAALRKEYSSKLKALFGGKASTPVKAPSKPATPPAEPADELPMGGTTNAPAATPEPEKRKPGRPPMKKPAEVSKPRSLTSDDVWNLLTKKVTDEEKAGQLYITEWEKIDPNRQELTNEQWGQVATALGV